MKRISSLTMWILLSVLVLLVFMVIIIPLLGLANEDKILQAELDNSHINNNFQDWKQITLADICSMHVPEGWQFLEKENSYQINDTQNNLLAYCFVVQKGFTQFQDTDFLEAIVDFEIIETKRQYISDVISIGNSDFLQLQICGKSKTEQFYRLRLSKNNDYTCIFLFPADGKIEYSQLLEIAQAIIYSHEFLVE